MSAALLVACAVALWVLVGLVVVIAYGRYIKRGDERLAQLLRDLSR